MSFDLKAAYDRSTAQKNEKKVSFDFEKSYNNEQKAIQDYVSKTKKELADVLSAENFDKDAVEKKVEEFANLQMYRYDRNLKNGSTTIVPIGDNLSNLFKAHGYDFKELFPDLAERYSDSSIESYAYHNSDAFKSKWDADTRKTFDDYYRWELDSAEKELAKAEDLVAKYKADGYGSLGTEAKALGALFKAQFDGNPDTDAYDAYVKTKEESKDKTLRYGDTNWEARAGKRAESLKTYIEELKTSRNLEEALTFTMKHAQEAEDFEEKSKPADGARSKPWGATEDEWKVYNYLYNTEGKASAENFYKAIKSKIKENAPLEIHEKQQEMEAKGGWNTVGSGLWQAGTAFASGGEGLEQAVKGTIDSFKFWENPEKYESGKYQTITTLNKEDSGLAGRIALGAVEASPQVLGTVAFSHINPTLGTAFLTTTAYGSGYVSSINEGGSRAQGIAMGVTNAVTEYFLEKYVGNTIEGLGTPISKKVTNVIAKTKPGAKVALTLDDFILKHPKGGVAVATFGRMIGGSSSEFMEEYLAETVAPIYYNLILNPEEKKKVTLFSQQQLEAGLIGAITGGVHDGIRGIVTLSNLRTEHGTTIEKYKALSDKKILEIYKDRYGSEARSADEARKFLIDSENFVGAIAAVSELAKKGKSYDTAVKTAKKYGINTTGFEEFTRVAYDLGATEAKNEALIADISKLASKDESTNKIADKIMSADKSLTREEAMRTAIRFKNKAFAESISELSPTEKAEAISEYAKKEKLADLNYWAEKNTGVVNYYKKNYRESGMSFDASFVSDAATKITSNLLSKFSKDIGNSISAGEIKNAVLRAIAKTGSIDSEVITREIADAFTASLPVSSNAYKTLSSTFGSASDALVDYVENGTIYGSVTNKALFKSIGDNFKTIADSAISQISNARVRMFGTENINITEFEGEGSLIKPAVEESYIEAESETKAPSDVAVDEPAESVDKEKVKAEGRKELNELRKRIEKLYGAEKAKEVMMYAAGVADSLAIDIASATEEKISGDRFLPTCVRAIAADTSTEVPSIIYDGITSVLGESGISEDGTFDVIENASNDIVNKRNELLGKAKGKTVDINNSVEEIARSIAEDNRIDDSVIDYNDSGAEGKVNWNDLSKEQQRAISFVKKTAEKFNLKLKFVPNGEGLGINGAYVAENDAIIVDVYAGVRGYSNIGNAIISTMSHEMTHWMKSKAAALYNKIDGLVFKALEKSDGKSREDRIRDEMKNLGTESYEEARDEIIARACEDMLAKSEFGKDIYNKLTKPEKKTFGQIVREIFGKAKADVAELLSEYKSGSKEATALRSLDSELGEISKAWNEALEQISSENDTESDSKTSKKKTEEKGFPKKATSKNTIVTLTSPKGYESAFKKSDQIIVGKEYITNGFVGILKSLVDTEKIKTYVNKKYSNISENDEFDLTKYFTEDANLMIAGDPKVIEVPGVDRAYSFKIDGGYYIYNQQFVDAFAKDGNTFWVNPEKPNKAMVIKNADGESIGLIMPIRSSSKNDTSLAEKTAKKHSEAKYVSEVLEQKRQSKALKVKGTESYLENTAKENTADEDGVKYSPRDVGYDNKIFDYGVSQNEINSYVEKAYQNENEKSYIKYLHASNRLVEEVSSDVDISGYSHALRDNDIRHIKNSHGETTNEKYPVTQLDIQMIPYVVENYDKVFFKTNANGAPGLVFVKVMPENVIYYVEAVTQDYGNEKLLVNKQMVKTGIDEIPNLVGLITAINKKESSSQYLADLKKIREAYVQDVKENYSTDSIPELDENVNTQISENKNDGKTVPEAQDVVDDFVKKHLDNEIRKSRRITAEQDAEYLKAVESGDTEAAQRMVDEAARDAGYNSPLLYHGTGAFGFTKFDLSKSDDKRTIFLTSNEKIASTYSGVTGTRKVSDVYDKEADKMSLPEISDALNDFVNITFKDAFEEAAYNYSSYDEKKLDKLVADVDKGLKELGAVVDEKLSEYENDNDEFVFDESLRIPKQLRTLKEVIQTKDYTRMSTPLWMLLNHTSVFSDKKQAEKLATLEKNIRLMNELKASENIKDGVIVEEALGGYSIEILSKEEASKKLVDFSKKGNYSMYAKMEKPFVVDGNGKNWNDITYYEDIDDDLKRFYPHGLWRHGTTRDVASYAKSRGYDSVIIKNLIDNGGRNSSVGFDEAADIYILFDAENAKSADPVTYDDNGKVVPLSERFNPQNDDIRYSERRNVDKQADGEYNERKETSKEGTKNAAEGYSSLPLHDRLIRESSQSSFGQSEDLFGMARARKTKTREERRAFAKKIISDKAFEYGEFNHVKVRVINENSFNEELFELKALFDKLNKTVYFLAGGVPDGMGGYSHGAVGFGGSIVVSYVGDESPWKVARHEIIHTEYNSETFAPYKKVVLDYLQGEILDAALALPRYEGCSEYLNSTNRVIEEMVCDIFAGSAPPEISLFDETVSNYWKKTEAMAWFNKLQKDPLFKDESPDSGTRFSLRDNGKWDYGDAWRELLEEYGAIPKGETPARDVSVPKKTEEDKPVSRTVRTVLEAEATPDEILPDIASLVKNGDFSYDVYTDKQAISDAEGKIKKLGWAKSLSTWLGDMEKGIVSKEQTATGWALYNNAANSGDVNTALDVLDAMVAHQRSAAQALQATRILKKLSPETQLYGVQKSVSSLEEELISKYKEKAPDIKINEELAKKFLDAKTQEERDNILKEIYKDIGRQMPSTWIDKWNAWRYLAMLGNSRTHVRNILGNFFFAPVVQAKDLTATAIESIVHGVTGKRTEKGKNFISDFSKKDRALLKSAWRDYKNVADVISSGGKYGDLANANKYIEEGRVVFKGLLKPLELLRKGNSKLLDLEDAWFSQPHYAYALVQYCKAHNISPEQIANGDGIDAARTYAIKEAQKATYRDTNYFSQMVSEWGRSNRSKNLVKKAFGTVVEGVLPFRKTPANILVRGVEYSPIGLLKGLTYDLYRVSKGDIKAYEAIDNISAGLTGTGLLALGARLAAEGLIRGRGEDEEEEREFMELMGHQAYALELPNGTSITLDWLAPEALPFFVGVNLWETVQNSGGEMNLSDILNAISNITEPMLEMSCLQSLNDLFDSVGYARSNDGSSFTKILTTAVSSYLSQVIPTLSGQVERTSEKERMTTYTEKNAFLTGDLQYTLGKWSAKITGWDFNQIPYIDAWGRKESSENALARGLDNFLNPAYRSNIEMSDMEKELLRLYELTGDAAVLPKRAAKYFTVDGKRVDLTAEQYVKYAMDKGKKSYNLITNLVNSNTYKSLDDSEKIEAIDKAFDYANQKAKDAVVSEFEPDTWVRVADSFGSNNVAEYLSFEAEVSNTKSENDGKITKTQVETIVNNNASTDGNAWKMYQKIYDSEVAEDAKDKGVSASTFMKYSAGVDRAKGEKTKATKAQAFEVISNISTNDDIKWALIELEHDSKGVQFAKENGISADTYLKFFKALGEVDKPTESGKMGTYNNAEKDAALRKLKGVPQNEKTILKKSMSQ